MCEIFCQPVQNKQEEKRIEEEQTAKAQNWKFPVCYDDDDDEEGYNSLNDNIIFELPSYSAVIPTEPVDSLIMEDEHLNTLLAMESDEFIKSCAENLVPNPVPAGFTTFSNVLFDDDYDSDSSDDQSLSVEDVREKIYSNPLFDEEIIPMEIDSHSFNAKSDLIGSMPSHDSSIIISLKIDSLFDEFVGELTLLKSFPPRIDETDCHPEKEIPVSSPCAAVSSSTCSSSAPPSSISCPTIIPSNKSVLTPENPFPTLLMLSKMYLENFNFLPVDKQMTVDAIAELNSFNESILNIASIQKIDDLIKSFTCIRLCEIGNHVMSFSECGGWTNETLTRVIRGTVACQYSDVHQPPEEISIDELKIMTQSYYEMMSQRSEQATQKEQELLEQEQAVKEKQKLLTEEQAANPSEPSPVSYFYNADYDNISTPSTTYTIHLTKSATIITNPSEPTRRIYHNHDIFYDGDDDEELFPDEVKRIQQILEKTSFDAITPEFSITDSLSMEDEHLRTIPKMESNKVIKSSVKNLVPILSEFEVTFDNESDCDVPVNDESSPIFTTFLNPLFDCNNDFTSNDDKSLSNEDVPMENFKIHSNPLFDDEEIISTKIDPHYFNVESNLLESLLNRDTLIDSSSKFDYLLEEFSGELAHIDPIPPRIEEDDFDLEEEIRLIENLSYDNSSPRPSKELNGEIADTILESLSPSPILVEDSDSLIEEIDLFLATYDLMPSGIENDDYDSEGDIHFLEELLSNDPLPLPENESSNFHHHDDLSFPRPPSEPPDVEVFFDFEPDTGVLTTKVVKGIYEHYVLMPNILPTLDPNLDFTHSHDSLGSKNKIFDMRIFIEVQSERLICDPFYPMFDTLLPFSSKNEDKVFKPGILSYLLVSHQDKTTFDFSENPMMMYGGDIPLLDVPYLHFYPFDQAQLWGIESGSRLG
nr:hypothetical protein [Tanacetum cinerariifolium]